MTALLMNIILMVLWAATTGDFGYGNLLAGFVMGYLVLWWVMPLLGPTAYFRKLPLTLGFVAVLFWEITKANIRVAWDIVTPNKHRRPGIIVVPLDAETDLEIAVLANLVTLTPGSLCIDISADRRTLFVHAMFADDPRQVRAEIKQRFEGWVISLLR